MTDRQAPLPHAAPVFDSGFCAPESRRFLLLAAILASALGFIDGSIVAIALPTIRQSLGADLVQAQWVHNAYMLTLSALILAGGALGDRIGLARAFAGGIALFVLASLACALAPGPGSLIAARALQGIGAAVMVPGSLAMIARAYPRETRGRAIGIWAGASALTTALGPILGGLLLSFGGPEIWRFIFAINLPLGMLALWLIRAHTGREARRGGDAGLDLPGALSATLALFCIAWALTSAGSDTAMLLPWLSAGGLLLMLFLWIESRSRQPMMPLALFANPVFCVANLMSFSLYAALGMMFFFMPMTFIAAWGYSEIEASAAFAPMSIFIAALSSHVGRLADRIGPAPLLVAGALLTGVGYAAMGVFAAEQDLWTRILPAMGLVGFGMALVVAPLSSAVMGAVAEDQSGVASGINNAVSRMAGLISVAAAGGLVAALYKAAGGQASFGSLSDSEGHAAAMTAAFAMLAYGAAGLCWLSALIAALGLRRAA
ncbi:MFS transporter [Sulfitobacter aestuarii]|uniref:MFS transporter n=1 Tax=Sulfitobacter aestuarii TaxID=2161676 RepID=A0ABW5U1Y0_9RHOB